MVSFINGECWIEDDNVLYGNFFGQQREMIIDVVSNIDQEKEKVFQAVGISTNNNTYDPSNPEKSWDSPEITVPETDINNVGGLTRIKASKFRQKEEALYSDIPRNINTKMSGTETYKLANGDVMRTGLCSKAQE